MSLDPVFVTAGLNVFIALLLGMLLGIERTLARKTAGLRTYGLVAMGSALFVVTTQLAGSSMAITSADMTRVIAGIITGIGFLCAGEIIRRAQSQTVVGLTTAAGLWVSSGIGIAAGLGLHLLAFFATVLTLLTFTMFWFVERGVTEMGGEKEIH